MHHSVIMCKLSNCISATSNVSHLLTSETERGHTVRPELQAEIAHAHQCAEGEVELHAG